MATQQPAYRAYTVVNRQGAEDFWLAIGAAFVHQDGDGYNIVLQALPIDGKIVLRLPKGDDVAAETPGRATAGADRENSRQKRR
jgi:hypothetical protein